jgi:hypothetical protein
MRRSHAPILFVAFSMALFAVAFGCNAILGNDPHTLYACKPGATDCSDAGAVLVCKDGKEWTEQEKCPFACASGACTGVCVPGTKQCNGQTPQTCDTAGQWQDETACTNACVDGACAGTCSPGATQCSGNTVQTCDSKGQWQDGNTCPFVCDNGACTGVCTPNDTQCSGNTTQVCDAKGQWQSSTTCPYVCDKGACTGSCVPNSVQCNGNVPQTCDATGTWQSGTPCPNVCSAGSCTGMCVPGTKQCSGDTPQTCNANGQWVDDATCPFVCIGGACTGVCKPNDMQCSGNTPQICNANGQWQSGTACPFVCTNGSCTGMCKPNTTQACGSVATCNSGGMQTCDATGTWGPCMPAASPCAQTPAGWNPVALTNGACPSGFGFPQAYISNVMASPYSCSCSCSGTQTCSGTGVLNQYSGSNCMGSPVASTTINFSTACGSPGASISIGGGNGYILSNVNFGPGPACGASPIATNKPTPVQTTVTVCQPNLACTGGACLSATEQAAMCVARSGSQTCPTGFPNKTVVSLGVTDTRSCGSCACGSTLGCTFNSLLIDNDSSCGTGNPYNFTEAAGMCVAAPNSFPFNADKANATVTGSGACVQTSPSNPTGGVTLSTTNMMTVCCP